MAFFDFFQANFRMTRLILAIAWLICLATPHFGHHPIPYVLAMGFIIAAVFGLPQERVFSFLDHRTTAFYGRISYSFYLFHFPIVYSMASAMLNFFDPRFLAAHFLLMSFFLMLLSVGIATPVAWSSYQWIEKPFVTLGKKLFLKPLQYSA